MRAFAANARRSQFLPDIAEGGDPISDWSPVETLSANPLLRSVSEGAVSVGLVGYLVVADAVGQAVPEDLQPAVAQGAQSPRCLSPTVIFSS
ncbi:MAG TPA: hypothetical protein VK784_14460 [Pseudonocardiaceae bacterium]|jgi:hypothetical protein|nr:hypothetical protein [Pseudonocardiaceae bacterium]